MADRRHIHLDAVGGVAGDMFVAALLDALPELHARVFADLAAVAPPDGGQPVLGEGSSGGIAARRFGLEAAGEQDHHHPHHGHDRHHADDHGHDHDHRHGHDHDHGHGHGHSHDHGDGTSFTALAARIGAAALSPGTAEQAIAILRVVAQAESRVHRQPVESVHFHELADWDSLMDVVAAGSLIAALPGVSWSVSPLPYGGGLVRTRHGLLPVPAPATAAILQGFAFRDDGIGGERVTPTGAAILAHLRPGGRPPAAGRLIADGSGAGTRDLPGVPNILRALVFEKEAEAVAGAADEVAVLSFDIDDMTGEEIGTAAERLRGLDGVLDLTIGARQGKKSRPAADFRLLVRPERLAEVGGECFRQTSTIGLRWRIERRSVLPRELGKAAADAALPVKRVRRPQGGVTTKVENDALDGLDSLAERRRVKRQAEQEE